MTSAASCRRRSSSGRKLRCAFLRQRDVDQRRDQGRIFVEVKADEPKRVLEVGEAPVGRLIRAEALSAPFGDRVQWRILQELRRRQFDTGVGRLAKRRAKLLHETRLADAGFADNEDKLARAIARPLPAPAQEFEFLLAPDERGQSPRAGAPPAARPHDAVKRDRRRHALELAGAAVFGDEQPGSLALHVRGHEHRTRLGQALNARGNIGRFAEHFARRLDHRRPQLEPDARGELRRAFVGVPGIHLSKRALDRERHPHRAFRVVLLRVRIAEQGHQPVAEPLQHVTAKRVTAVEASSRYALTRLRQSSASSRDARAVEPTRSQNMTVIGRRSASGRNVRGGGEGAAGGRDGSGAAPSGGLRLRLPSSGACGPRGASRSSQGRLRSRPARRRRRYRARGTSLRIGRGRSPSATRRRPWPRSTWLVRIVS